MAYTGTSYGMNLQAFATQYVVEKLGFDTVIFSKQSGSLVNYVRHNKFDLSAYYYILKTKLKKKNRENVNSNDELYTRNRELRLVVARDFREAHLHNIMKSMSYTEMHQFSKQLYAVIIGSDQCWLPGFCYSYNTSLGFVAEGTRRISYSTSLGVSTYPNSVKASSRRAWKKFNNISVREQEGVDIIKNICGNDITVELVIDPTYLIDREEWNSLIPIQHPESEPYVLCFILGNNYEQYKCARRFADKSGLKLLTILTNECYVSASDINADRLIIGASPEDFVNYIRDAEFIFTDSFHGIAFSIINHKQVFVFYRKRDDATGTMSRHSRIDNILRLWHIQHRLITNPACDWNKTKILSIDYSEVDKLKEKMRLKSYIFLKKSLALL